MCTIFISYSHTDTKVADEIVATLDELGVKSFRDMKDIKWGQAISAKVRDGLHSASAMIVIVSPGSLQSQWVAYEVGFGTGTRKRVLPYLTHESLVLPGFMSDLSYVKSIDQVRNFFNENTDWHLPHDANTPTPVPRTATLNQMQIEYLMTISKPRNGGLISSWIDNETGREAAQYQEAVALFLQLDILQYNGDAYKLTPTGWRLVNQLWSLAIVDVLDVDNYKPDLRIAEGVGLTDGKSEIEELRRHIDTLENKGFVNVSRNRSGVFVMLTQRGATYRKHRPIEA